jgi:hypothetical protein
MPATVVVLGLDGLLEVAVTAGSSSVAGDYTDE